MMIPERDTNGIDSYISFLVETSGDSLHIAAIIAVVIAAILFADMIQISSKGLCNMIMTLGLSSDMRKL